MTQITGHEIEVTVDPAFVRRDELHELYGDPTRLGQTVGPLTAYRLQDTLHSVLASVQAQHG